MFVGLLVCLSAFYGPHDICPLCGAASEWPREQDQPSSGAAPRAGGKCMHVHSESTRAHAVQLLNEKIVALMHDAFQKQNRTRAHAVVYVTAEIFKKREKEKQHATSQVQFTVCLLLECLLFESY